MTESRAALAELAEQDAIQDVPSAPERLPRLPTPLHDYLLLKIEPRGERVRESGLIEPDVVQDEPIEGVVVAVGPGRLTDSGGFLYIDGRLQPGATVLFAKYAGFELEVERQKYRMVRSEEVLGVYP